MELESAWDRALELAWQSFLTGTTPVGAVVVDAAGVVAAEGRGRRYEEAAAWPQLSYSHVAHAELNALALLPPVRHYEDHILLTTLEPCCMCLGAAVQSSVLRLQFAGRDPYAGASRLVIDTPQGRRRRVAVTGPLAGPPGRLAELLHVCWLLEHGGAAVLEVQRRGIPEVYALAAGPAGDLFARLRASSACLAEALAASRDLFR